MIKKEIQEVTYCDNCEKKGDYYFSCHGCGKTYCYDCRRFYKDFPNAVHFSGSDLRLCTECLKNPPKKIEKAFRAYKLIESLRAEEAKFYESFKPRYEAAEMETKRVYDEIRGWK